MLSLNNISLKLSNHTILHSLNLTIAKGEMIIVLGSNGSGKSSLLKVIDRRFTAHEGEILFQERPLKNYSTRALTNKIVSLSQNSLESLFPHLTVDENYRLALTRAKIKYSQQPIEYLASYNSNLITHKNNLVASLSGGEQQTLVLALACLTKPDVLLLDEHTSALDPHTAEKLMRLTSEKIKENNITCLLTTHNLDLAHQYGTRLIALKQGKIARDFSHDEKRRLSIMDLKNECYTS